MVSVFLLNDNKTDYTGRSSTQFISDELVYTENVPGTLGCVALGGYPPADIAVYVGGRDVTPQLAHAHSAAQTGSRGRGLRRIEYTAERWTHKMAAGAQDDGKEARCVASVSGLPANTTLARIVVNCTFCIAQRLPTLLPITARAFMRWLQLRFDFDSTAVRLRSLRSQ